MREAPVPTEQPQAEEEARLSQPDAIQGWPSHPSLASAARSQAPVSLIRRVRDRATFAALTRARRSRRGPITLRFLGDPEGDDARVAYAIGRSAGSAVRRNRARRRMRAAIAEVQSELAPGAYLFGIADDRLERVAPDELRVLVRGLVEDAGALR
jgi:ribonuclease P protein component